MSDLCAMPAICAHLLLLRGCWLLCILPILALLAV